MIDIYNKKDIRYLCENDEITLEEEAFMEGYCEHLD